MFVRERKWKGESERERSREVTKIKREKVLQELRVQNNQCLEVLVHFGKIVLVLQYLFLTWQSVTMVNNKATARLQVQTKTNEILWATDMTLFCHIGMRFRPSIIASRPTAMGHQSHSLGCYTSIRENSICLGYPSLVLFFLSGAEGWIRQFSLIEGQSSQGRK